MAKKRYHASAREHNRYGEEDGPAIVQKQMPEYYAGEQARFRQEMQDAGMIREDHSAVANLPQNVIMRPYPRAEGYLPEVLDDSIRGIDMQVKLDDSQRSRHFLPKKV